MDVGFISGGSGISDMYNLSRDYLVYIIVNLAELDAIADTASIHVFPYGAITVQEKGEALADMDALADRIVAFSDDGRGVQSESMMRAAMEKAAAQQF